MEIMETMKNKKKKVPVRLILAGICSVVFLGCVAWLTVYFVNLSRAEEQLEDIKDSYVQDLEEPAGDTQQDEHQEEDADFEQAIDSDIIEDADAETGDVDAEVDPEGMAVPGPEGYDVPMKQIDFAALQQEENADIYAWITVPGTVIDYPIVQHPELPDYYLDHNLDGSKGYPGGIYTQLYNSKDWNDQNTVIYGHNMKNGTAFAGLHQYEDSQFFEENSYVYIYTEDGKVKVYEIFAAYEYTNINLVTTYLLLGQDSYAEYLDSIYSIDGMNNNFNTDITVGVEDKIITLETCIANKPDKRYLVQAVLKAEGSVQ